MSSVTQAYCVKCREKRDINNPQATYTKTGSAITKGTCGVCGTTITRIGVTEAHASVPKPPVEPRARKNK